MLWFGYNSFAPICETGCRVETPIGASCLWCDDPIGPDANGFMLGLITPRGIELKPWHHECYLRMLVGGLYHQQRRCTCYGGYLQSDPAEMTIHEAALAAAAFYAGVERSSL
jgi:hypothetical protein